MFLPDKKSKRRRRKRKWDPNEHCVYCDEPIVPGSTVCVPCKLARIMEGADVPSNSEYREEDEPPHFVQYAGETYMREDVVYRQMKKLRDQLKEETELASWLSEKLDKAEEGRPTKDKVTIEPQVRRVRLKHWPTAYLGLVVDNEE